MLERIRKLLKRRNQAKHEQADLVKLQDTYRRVFGGSEGELVLADICKRNFVFDSTFVQRDPYETALQEGQRRAALSIFRFIERDPSELIQQRDDNENPT